MWKLETLWLYVDLEYYLVELKLNWPMYKQFVFVYLTHKIVCDLTSRAANMENLVSSDQFAN